MDPASTYSMGIVAYLALFAVVGLIFLAANLLLGRFLRPRLPYEEKQGVYECGEPTIGSSFVQFDLRFYVVALLFIVFDVEIAFFFPWAMVFGKADHLADERMAVVTEGADGGLALTDDAEMLYRELGVREPTVPAEIPASMAGRLSPAASKRQTAETVIRSGADELRWLLVTDIAVFFAVLMVGFAYVWRRGDLDWVRAIERARGQRVSGSRGSPTGARQPTLSA